MSGICGAYCPCNPSQATAEILDRMLAAISHRGGAAQRRMVDQVAGVAVGHVFDGAFRAPRRIGPPNWCGDQSDIVTLDGAVFNAAPFVKHLDRVPPDQDAACRGVMEHLRRSPSTFPGKLDGHFALAAWEGGHRRLLIARDPLGAKPLYYLYRYDLGLLVFASELKGVLAHPAARRQVNRAALSAYLSYGYVPAPLSIFEDVCKVFPGESIALDASGRLTCRQYASLPSFRAGEGEMADFREGFRSEMLRAVAKHIDGAGRIGLFFSGGLDSTVLLGILRTLGAADVETFTLGFRVEGRPHLYDDLDWAERLAGRCGVQHHSIAIGPGHDLRPLLPAIVRQFDEPMLTPNAYSKYFLSEAARRCGIVSCLSGSHGEYLSQRVPEKKLRKWREAIGPHATDEDVLLGYRVKFFSFQEQKNLLLDPVDDPREVARSVHERYQRDIEADDLGDLIYGISVRLQGAEKSGTVQDRTSALNGVEIRHPLFDLDLLSLANRVPGHLKGRSDKAMQKAMLKSAFHDLLPTDVTSREKIGYPSYYWTQGELRDLKADLLSPQALERTGLFDPAFVRRVLDADQRNPDRAEGKKTWGLLFTQAWFDFHVNGHDGAAAGRSRGAAGASP